ncbi:transcription factor FAMA [Cucumis sativus]|uniref:BHLH domain-containing protein n=1 Tax=Cucumis sativus TaxID=3659 RepID=A0A0A0L9F4_CUCSA|nr:transcription factor FAMA [Cucumis sativus]KGN56741.1 hypothetical protein Csa_011237 [Cucumis sativus]
MHLVNPMEKDDNYSNEGSMAPSFSSHQDLYNNQDQFMRSRPNFETSADNSTGILTYFPPNPITSPDKLSFGEVMQFADFGPKLSLNRFDDDDSEPPGIDPVYFLKFPVLNNERVEDTAGGGETEEAAEIGGRSLVVGELEEENFRSNNNNNNNNGNNGNNNNNNKRKRGRTVKTSEEVESQRMTHIAVERNRRKQMNEHLRVLRSLMPGSYVQRGDQASIIGGAIEFVRELEQLLQCLESQKRRRLLGEPPIVQAADTPPQQQPPFLPPGAVNFPGHQNDAQIFETTAESKSCLADVEVKVVGFDAMIKILSRRRPGQLIKAIAALEDLQLNILHTNITTIEQTVLYSFNVKIASESRFTAEDIASSVQQIFNFIHANTGM